MPENLPPHVPADLDAFWLRTLERTRAQPLEATVEEIKERVPYFVRHVTYKSLGGIPIRAHLGLPVDATRPTPGAGAGARAGARRYPAIVTGPGYGGWEMGTTLSDCQRGYIVLQVFPRSQGESGNLWRVEDGAYQAWVNHGRANQEGFYYQGAYMDLVRGIDYLLTRPDVDPDRIGLVGTSQGGLLVLGTAGVDRRVKAVVAHLPALCDLRHNAGLGSELLEDPVFLNTWNYFDPVNLAHRITAPTLLSTGGLDKTCPTVTIRAVFDQLAGIKSVAHYPDLIHTSSRDFYNLSWEWVRTYLE